MTGNLQPLDQKFPVVKNDGTPTDYFIRWAQQRQIDISGGITAEQAQQLINDWAAAREIIAGAALNGGGNLAADVTIDHADQANDVGTFGTSTKVARITVDAQGHVTDVEEVTISGGGGGGGGPFAPWTVPVLADFTPLNQGGQSYTDNLNGIVFQNPAGMGFQTRGLIANAAPPATPWDLYVRMDTSLVAGEGNSRVGVTLQNAGGRLSQFGFRNDSNALHLIDIIHWNSPSSYAGEATYAYYLTDATWIRIENDGTNLNYYIGDGYNWMQVLTETLASWLGAVTGAGITLQSSNISMFSFNSFSFTAPAPGGGSPA